jgi:hypothetical protein
MTRRMLCGGLLAAFVLLTGCSSAPSPPAPTVAETEKEIPTESPAPVEQAVEPLPPAESVHPSPTQEPEEISFDDLNLQLQPNVAFRPWMLTDRAHELDGRVVQIAGYMLPDTKQKGIGEFVLLRNTECKFGPGGQPDHLLAVTMNKGLTTFFRGSPIQVEGTLKISPYQGPEGITWYIYELNDAEKLTTMRR